MKKRSFRAGLSSNGILRWSTICILGCGLPGCDRGVEYVASEQDAEMAASQTQLEKLDGEKSNLINGEVTNNFYIQRVGYYHAEARAFFEHPYGFEQDGRFFINGVWQDHSAATSVSTSRPSPEALKKVEEALEQEQKLVQNQPASQSHGSGFGMGNALMMYWLLSGNRGMFGGGNGFRQAGGQVAGWQQDVDNRRNAVSSHAAANPGYQRMMEQSRVSGTTVKPGQSVRGGFGSSRSGSRSGGFSSGS